MLDLIRQRSASWGVKIAFGIIILVFIFWGVGSYTHTGPGTVATVNGKPILMQDFQRELQLQEEQLRAMAPDISSEEMRQLRLPQQVLNSLVARALVDQEAKRLGITVTPREYASMLRRQPVFMGPDGKFSQELYMRFVENQGRNIADFEQSMMRDMLMSKMQEYVTSAVLVTPGEARRIFDFEMEQRTISYVLFATDKYRDGITITDDAIKAYYDANQAQFAQPATIAVSYIDVTPDSLAASMDVSEAEVDAAFNAGPLRYETRDLLLPVPDGTEPAKEAAMKAKLEQVAKAIRQGKEFAEAIEPLTEEFPDAHTQEGWSDAKRIPAELLGALAGLNKGDVTSPVKMEKMLVLMQLIETSPDWSLPENEIKAALRAAIGKDKATIAFRDVQAQAEDMVALGKPLAEIAKEIRVEARTTQPVPRNELVTILGLRRPSQVSLFEGDKGTLVNAILETREGFLVAEIAETTPAGVKPLDAVTGTIRDVLAQREAEKKAEEAARAAAPGFADGVPEALKAEVITSEPFNRQGVIPGLGWAKSLTEAAFTSPLDIWIKEPFATPKGAVLAMPAEIIPANDEEWKKAEARYMEVLTQAQKGQLMNAFFAELHKNADIQVVNQAIFEQ